MATRGPGKPTVSIVIRDEATAALDRAKRELLDLSREGKFSGLATEMKGLEGLAFGLRREFDSILRITGVSAVIATGGLVASLAAMTSALANFARESQQTRYVAEEIGLSFKDLVKLSQVARIRGLDAGQARLGIENVARSLTNLRRYEAAGPLGETYRRLLEELGPIGGVDLRNEFLEVLNGQGMRAAILYVFRRMREVGGTADNQVWAKEAIARAMGLPSIAFADITEEELVSLGAAIEDNRGETEQFLLQLTFLEAEVDALTTTFGVALTPAFTELVKIFNQAVGGPEGNEFKKWLITTVAKLKKVDWASQRQRIVDAFPVIRQSLASFFGDIAAFIADSERINRIIARWRGITVVPEISGQPWGGATAGVRGLPGTPSGPPPITGSYRFAEQAEATPGGRFVPDPNFLAGREQYVGVAGGAIEDRRAEEFEPRRRFGLDFERRQAHRDLVDQVKDFRDELFLLNDWLRERLGGFGGAPTEGGVVDVSGGGRRTSWPEGRATQAGGAGGVPLPPARPLTKVSAADIYRGSGSSLVQLGLLRAPLYSYPEVYADPKAQEQLHLTLGNIEKMRTGIWRGFSITPTQRDPTAAMAYDPRRISAPATVAHEAAHVGRRMVELYAQKNEPNIFRRYGMKTEGSEREEMGQRALDVVLAGNLLKQGMISEAGAQNQVEQAMSWLEERKQPIKELLRHEAAYEVAARKIMENESEKIARLQLNINVRGERGQLEDYDAKVEGGLINPGVQFRREMMPTPEAR